MPEKQNHIIYSHSVELEFYDRKENLFIQNRIADLVKDRLLPAMEILFDEQSSSGKKIKIDQLELDLAEIQNSAWEDEFVNKTIYYLRQKLNEIVAFTSADEVYQVSYTDDRVNINGIPVMDECISNLDFFLRSGLLQWDLGQVTASSLLDAIIKAHRSGELTTSQQEKLTRSVFYSASGFERFILQFDHEALVYFFERILHLTDASVIFSNYKEVLLSSKEMIPRDRQALLSWLFVLMRFQTGSTTIPAMPQAAQIMSWIKKEMPASLPEAVVATFPDKHLLKKVFFESDGNIPGETQVTEEHAEQFDNANLQTTKKATEDLMECFINNSGLVILSPFLQQLFNNLKLSRKKQFRSEEHQVRGILLSQFLVTGVTRIAENELPLNKILCGYPLEKTLPCEFEPTEEELEQCNQLFRSVLEYWEALKSTSTEALRNTYIKRNGKLINKNDYWLLQVEYKSYDVMLQFLPWSIGIIYLPWMKKRLMVEWHA